MKKKKHRLLIPFSSLKEGKHEFDFTVDSTFFEQFEQSLVEEAEVNVHVDFEKKKNLLELAIDFSGTVGSVCDRCSDPIEIEIESEDYLIVKFGDEESTDEHIMYIPDSAYELDISDQVYQLINLALPAKIEHENEEDCDQEMINKLKEYSIVAEKEKEVDPRWDALNKLKEN